MQFNSAHVSLHLNGNIHNHVQLYYIVNELLYLQANSSAANPINVP